MRRVTYLAGDASGSTIWRGRPEQTTKEPKPIRLPPRTSSEYKAVMQMNDVGHLHHVHDFYFLKNHYKSHMPTFRKRLDAFSIRA
jgi:hypothetical protein